MLCNQLVAKFATRCGKFVQSSAILPPSLQITHCVYATCHPVPSNRIVLFAPISRCSSLGTSLPRKRVLATGWSNILARSMSTFGELDSGQYFKRLPSYFPGPEVFYLMADRTTYLFDNLRNQYLL